MNASVKLSIQKNRRTVVFLGGIGVGLSIGSFLPSVFVIGESVLLGAANWIVLAALLLFSLGALMGVSGAIRYLVFIWICIGLVSLAYLILFVASHYNEDWTNVSAWIIVATLSYQLIPQVLLVGFSIAAVLIHNRKNLWSIVE